MNTAHGYRCYNPRCSVGNVPRWMLGSNRRCPKCGHWLTRQPNDNASVKKR